MENHAPLEPHARVRLTHEQAQELVLRTVATQAESLLRTATRNSLCADDAQDAYQRSMEIFLRRARTLDPRSAHKWLHVVVKREAQALRQARSGSVSYEAVDFEHHTAPEVSTPEERLLTKERAARAAEALRRLKPQERRAMGLKAMGHSYAEISEATGFSGTKVNRCLTEGRKSFLERFEGIEAGAECERWRPVLLAMVGGEATAAQLTEARPHLRNCPACRATLRSLHQSHRPLKAVLPMGLVSFGAKLSGLIERLLPGAGGGDASGAAAGGAGFLGVGGAKLAGLLAAGAAATAGGGLVVAHHGDGRHAAAAAAAAAEHAVRAKNAAVAPQVAITQRATTATRQRLSHAATVRAKHRQLVGRRSAIRPIEFVPRGREPVAQATSAPTMPRAVPAAAPQATTPLAGSDSTRGEFAPQP
jgi:RNA polymerase sigma factor (sigma-70 family)